MSDTFANIQDDADRVSIMIRAMTILTQERNGIFGIVSERNNKCCNNKCADIYVPTGAES